MTIDMDMPFAEFAEKHLKRAEGNNSARTPGSTASPEVGYHKKCHDCGRFVKRSEWVPKNHSWKAHALCDECLSGYESPYDY